MNRAQEIHTELNAISHTVAAIPFNNPYALPKGYFNGMAEAVMGKIDAGQQTVSLNNDFKQSANQGIPSHDELMSLPTTSPNFEIPENYFVNNPEVIIHRIHSDKKTSPIYIGIIFKLSVAAICTGLLGWLIFMGLNNSSTGTIPTHELTEAARIVKTNSFEKEMDALDDNEIISYLNASGHDVKTAIVASLTVENNLPAPEEYIFDEKTLDNYLHAVNISEINYLHQSTIY